MAAMLQSRSDVCGEPPSFHGLAQQQPPPPAARKPFHKAVPSSLKKPLKVLVVGQAGVGKSALTVRFLTGRFIGDYDPTLEDIYTHEAVVNNELVFFQILDSGGHSKETEQLHLESNIRWADAFLLMYSVTDKCSFDECIRLKFFINLYTRKRHILSNAPFFRDHHQSSHAASPSLDVPVVLVANKADQSGDRMVTTGEGRRRCHEIGCISFHEISVRESVEDAKKVFAEIHARWKMWQLTHQKSGPKKSMSQDSPPHIFAKTVKEFFTKSSGPMCFPQRVTSECSLRQQNSQERSPSDSLPPELFRARACTDGSLHDAERWRSRKGNVRLASAVNSPLKSRRMSFSMRGSTSK